MIKVQLIFSFFRKYKEQRFKFVAFWLKDETYYVIELYIFMLTRYNQ